MASFTIELPEPLRELGYSDEEIRREVPVLLVLKRFRQRAISSAKAANLLELSRREFLDLLAREGIPLYDPTGQELAEEIETARQFGIGNQ
jgi:predicted HTH domain antitoxin